MARKHNIVVVGNGLFGSIAATLARSQGHTVTVVSDNQPYAASNASGCVLAPSWLSSLSKDQINTGMSILSSLYAVEELTFQTNLVKTFKAHRVNPAEVLVAADVEDRVTSIGDGLVTTETGLKLRGKVLVAAGVWTKELMADMPAMKGLWGASLWFTGSVDAPRINVYAPYRQAVIFNIDKNKVWMGDGTALIERTWQAEKNDRVRQTVDRCMSLFGTPTTPARAHPRIGVRPYVEGHKGGYFVRARPNTWISTGGAKNGTMLAAWQAHRFMEELP